MQEDPVYDYPDPQPIGERWMCPQRGSLKSISVLDRLLLTYPVWLQLSMNSATALHILQREPPGTFLVRKSTTSQKKMLCVRLADDSMPSFVKQFVIREEDSTFSLERSAISFPDLCRLIAFYCVSRDVLPFTLEFPEAIAKATSHKQLESISHMGVEFWSSQLNFRGPRNGPPPVPDAPLNPGLTPDPTPKDCSASASSISTLFQEFCPIHTRSPSELDFGAGQGALCFINPLFLQEQSVRGVTHKRHHFKRSFKVRVSTENSSSLSPPVSPPPPPPLLAKAKSKGTSAQQTEMVHTSEEAIEMTEAVEADSEYLQPCLSLPKKASAMVIPTLSPTAEEDDYKSPTSLLKTCKNLEKEEEDEHEGLELVLEQRPVPSLSELDSSSSLSSLDETEESPERPPYTRGTSNPVIPSHHPLHQPVSALRKMSAAFVSFFVPGKRVARLVEDLSCDRCTAFGKLIQDFLREEREALKPQSLTSAVKLLQGLRVFINQAKNFLQECGELEPPIETLVPEDEKDQTLEKAMFRCVLKPLKAQIYAALSTLHEHDGTSERIAESMRRARENSPSDLFGVRVPVPDAHGIEKIKRKVSLMKLAYSPIDKIHLLLQICKLIYKAMKSSSAQVFGADDFLPVLSYVIVQSNMPELFLEVEYMMELLENPWITGEGGYYLTSVYASLSHIQSEPEAVPPGTLTQQVRDSLKEWSRRRSSEAKGQKGMNSQQRFVKVFFQDEECCLVKTLQWKAGVNGEALAQLCAVKFGVDQPEEYGLYCRSDGDMIPLPSDAQIQDLQGLGARSSPLVYQQSSQDVKSHNLTRGEALDISAEAL